MTMRRALFVLLVLLAGPVDAVAQVAGPSFTFVADTIINPDEVNSNFATIYANALNRTGGTMTGPLIFSADNTHDIGASGTTRPRDFFLGRNATIGGDLTLSAGEFSATSTTAPQWLVRYDGSNYLEGSVSSAGAVTLNAVGSGAAFALSDALTVTGAFAASGIATFSGEDVVITGAASATNFRESGATANEGNWRLVADGDALTLQTIDDALSPGANIFQVTRTGTTVDSFSFSAAKTIFPAGSISAPSIALTEAVGTANDSGLLWTSGSVAIGVNGSVVATFNNSGSTLTGPIAATAIGDRVLDVNRTSSDGTLISLLQAGVEEGTISVSGTTVSYNTFMGSHYTQLQPGQASPMPGTVVVTTGRAIPARPRVISRYSEPPPDTNGLAHAIAYVDAVVAGTGDHERFVYVEPSSRRNQTGVYGVWFAPLGKTAAGMSWGDPDAEVYQVAGLGLATVWVTDTCGPIRRGNLLATSPLPGLAERQCDAQLARRYDGVVRDYTLGKALVDVDWTIVSPDADGVRKVRIAVVLFAG